MESGYKDILVRNINKKEAEILSIALGFSTI